MKKLLSILCMALIAGGLMFSCNQKKQYTVTVSSADQAMGTVTGGGVYDDGSTVTITAVPNDGYVFEKWQDGSQQNPRTITIEGADQSWTAYFKVASTPTPDPEPESAVRVSFNGNNWNAGQVEAVYYDSYNAWDVYSMETAQQLPIADVCMMTTTTGTYNAAVETTGGNAGKFTDENFFCIEYYHETALTEQNSQGQTIYYGDYWAKQANVNITSFDATALTLTANVNATMFSSKEAFVNKVGVEAAPTAPMTVNINGVTLTSAKSAMKRKGSVSKLVAVK